MIAQFIYIAVMLAIVSVMQKKHLIFDMFTEDEWEYYKYTKFMNKVEKKMMKRRLEEIFAELEKMYNATLILQTNNLNFEKMLELVPEMAALRKEALG